MVKASVLPLYLHPHITARHYFGKLDPPQPADEQLATSNIIITLHYYTLPAKDKTCHCMIASLMHLLIGVVFGASKQSEM